MLIVDRILASRERCLTCRVGRGFASPTIFVLLALVGLAKPRPTLQNNSSLLPRRPHDIQSVLGRGDIDLDLGGTERANPTNKVRNLRASLS